MELFTGQSGRLLKFPEKPARVLDRAAFCLVGPAACQLSEARRQTGDASDYVDPALANYRMEAFCVHVPFGPKVVEQNNQFLLLTGRNPHRNRSDRHYIHVADLPRAMAHTA